MVQTPVLLQRKTEGSKVCHLQDEVTGSYPGFAKEQTSSSPYHCCLTDQRYCREALHGTPQAKCYISFSGFMGGGKGGWVATICSLVSPPRWPEYKAKQSIVSPTLCQCLYPSLKPQVLQRQWADWYVVCCVSSTQRMNEAERSS